MVLKQIWFTYFRTFWIHTTKHPSLRAPVLNYAMFKFWSEGYSIGEIINLNVHFTPEHKILIQTGSFGVRVFCSVNIFKWISTRKVFDVCLTIKFLSVGIMGIFCDNTHGRLNFKTIWIKSSWHVGPLLGQTCK